MRNNVARFMDGVNKSGFHKDIKREFILDNSNHLTEGLSESYIENNNKMQTVTPKWLKNLQTTSSSIDPKILERYFTICVESLPNVVLEIRPIEGDETNPVHLLWMLDQIQSNNEMSLTKKHRWLGYIQGVLVMKGEINVTDEREYTRNLFNGS